MLDAPQVYQAVDTDQPVAVIFEDMQFAPEAIFVSNDSKIQKVEELKGTTVGLASDRDRITLQVALESVGMSMDDVQTAVVGDAGATLANAFRNQTVSAVAGGTSDMAAVEANGILIRDITPPAVSENPANSFVIWKPRMDELRDPVQKFLKAWAKGMEAGALDLDFTAAIMTKEIPEQWEKREVGMKLLQRTANQLHKPLTERRGDLQPAIWDRVQAPYIEIGEISKKLDPATFLDDSFVAGANEYTKEELQADIDAYKEANPDMFK
jgi:NitT/TauT family transport system substrate-binding protein